MVDRLWHIVQATNRVLTVLTYPLGIVFMLAVHATPTLENAKILWARTLAIWMTFSVPFYTYTLYGVDGAAWSWSRRASVHFLWFWMVDATFFWIMFGASALVLIFQRKTNSNRLFGSKEPQFLGKRIVVLGNGPSIAEGDPLGAIIDEMDEVVRFNNFQTAKSGLQAWTGSKTTVHFSDTMLYPSYPEYHSPGACVVLSLFMDRLIVAGSYCVFRTGVDLELLKAYRMFGDPGLGWVSHEDINNLKATLNLSKSKHPTSGVLAIDWFSRHRPDPNVPIYIHGFDFFAAGKLHYYDESEPLYERLNDLLGVKMMHQPDKEKAFVLRLVKEGKVKWLRDLGKSGDHPGADSAQAGAADAAGSSIHRTSRPVA